MAAKGEQTAFVYTTYIKASAEQVWQGLTDPAVMKRYWRHQQGSPKAFLSDWQNVLGSSGCSVGRADRHRTKAAKALASEARSAIGSEVCVSRLREELRRRRPRLQLRRWASWSR
jgi:hypothetical protein